MEIGVNTTEIMKRFRECLNILEVEDEPEEKNAKRKKIAIEKFGLQSSVSAKPIDIFGLNADVMRIIFAYCTVLDLYALTRSSDQLRALILANSIGGRMFDFDELTKSCHILDVFKMFGKQMTHIKFGESDVQYKEESLSKFDEILRLIATYCSIDTLKHLELQYFYGTRIKKKYMYAVLPFLRCIESFSLAERDEDGFDLSSDYFAHKSEYNSYMNDLVERTIGNAKNLTSLQLERLKVTGRFFYADHIRNLKCLSIVESILGVPDGFVSFLKNLPKLTSFKWWESSLLGVDTFSTHSSNIVYELVADNFPELEILHYNPNPYFMDERDHFDHVPHYQLPNQMLIRQFRKLRVLKLGDCEMEIDCLMFLAEMNTVEELDANVEIVEDCDFLHSFTKLKSVSFITWNEIRQEHINYLSGLPQLTEFHLKLTDDFAGFEDVLVKVVESAKHLSVLRVSVLEGKLNFCRFSKLLKARLAHNGDRKKPLTIYFHDETVSLALRCYHNSVKC